jgi:hypothetical protein
MPLPDPLPDEGIAPYDEGVPIPTEAWNDAPLVCLRVNQNWATYIAGALFSLLSRSAWATEDRAAIHAVRQQVMMIQAAIGGLTDCTDMLEFQANPADTLHWQYRAIGAPTWIDGPATTFPAAPTDVVKTDPLTDIVNVIAPITGVPGLAIKALNDFALYLESNDIGLHLTRSSERGAMTNTPVVEIDATLNALMPLIETIIP